MPQGWVAVVTGPPGAGKTTVARAVTEAVSPSVHLHADDFWDCIGNGRISPYLPESQQQNEVVVQVVAEAAFGYARNGYCVVVDGIVGPWFIDVFRALSSEHDVPLHYVVLRPDEAVALERAVGREAPALTDDGPVRKMYAEFSELGSYEAFVLDNGRQAPDETASQVVESITGGSHRLAPGAAGERA